ncbi:MAG: hypothetical protein PVI91_04140 [Gammaproteobacteria bacterium]|jgi:hypothetical protein
MSSLDPEVEKAVDSICALGCERVTAYIAALEKTQTRPEYRLLDARQRVSLLQELRSIMAVYQHG